MPDGQPQEHTQDVTAQAAPASDQPPLVERLRELGQTLNPSEIPGGAEIGHLLGALLKTVEHDGLKVADELFPEPVAAPPIGAGPGGAPAGRDPQVAEHADRIGRIETALEDLIRTLREPGEPPAPDESGGAQ